MTSLAEIAAQVAAAKLPPVDQWHPAHCGDSDMRIARDGTWYHQGSPIGRQALVKLFASILRREADGSFVLVTPGEKLNIVVDDAPFSAVELNSEGQGERRRIGFRLNTDEHVIAGPAHPIRFDVDDDGAPRPYIGVRRGLDALIVRAAYYELVELALDEHGSPPGVWSDGAFFALPGT